MPDWCGSVTSDASSMQVRLFYLYNTLLCLVVAVQDELAKGVLGGSVPWYRKHQIVHTSTLKTHT